MLKVKLVVVGGATERDEFQPSLPAVLGRSRNAEVPLPHPLVSRRHCELIEKDERLFVRDLGSTNGTFVGSERVDAETVVEHGSLLTIGTVTFRAYYDDRPLPEFPADPAASVHQAPETAVGKIDTATITRIDTGSVGGASKKNPLRTGQNASENGQTASHSPK